jgi:type IV secretion system protein VirB6
MNEAAPITWLIDEINAIVAAGASAAATTLAGAIMPLVAACFAIYMMMILLNYMRGAEDNFVGDFMYRVIGFAVVLGLGVNAGNYVAYVMPIVTGLGGDLGAAISGGSASANSLDTLVIKYMDIVNEGFDSISLMQKISNPMIYVDLLLKALIIILTLTPFLVAATLMLIVANVGSVIIAMVGPIYMACLIFPATRSYFSAWLNTAFSYALVPLIVAVISLISVGISDKMLTGGTNISDISFKLVLFCGVGNLILLLLVKQVSALASSLSAGGINMGGGGGVGSAASAIRTSIRGSGQDIKGAASAVKAINKLATRAGGSIKAG